MVEKNLNDLQPMLGNLFSVNLILVGSQKVKELGIDLPTIFKRFTHIDSLNGTFRDPLSNAPATIPSLYVKFRDINELNFSSNSATIKKVLHQGVSRHDPLNPQLLTTDSHCPWYEEWKSIFLTSFELCDHEFIGANFGAVFVITASELIEHRQVMSELNQRIKQLGSIRWFQPNFLRYYLVINHINASCASFEQDPNTRTYFEEIKLMYGSNVCYWLDVEQDKDYQLLPSPPPPPASSSFSSFEQGVAQLRLQEGEHPLSQPSANVNDTDDEFASSGEFNSNQLTTDLERRNSDTTACRPFPVRHGEILFLKLETMIRELLINALLPWSEKQIKLLNEAIQLRKGLRRSIFSATKQLLQMSNTVPYRNSGSSNVVYSPDSNEMQPRKLADLAMCLRLFELASQFYSQAKREFQTDSAWLYYAGACEANAIACFQMNRLQKQEFETAISCYLDTCKVNSLASRTTLLATDICRRVWPIDTAAMFIKLTDKEHNLKSALFLEQAARCFLCSLPPRRRRAAFHYVLAGNRYSRCGMKRHALHCYLKYGQPSWPRCSDHVNHTLAKLHLQLASSGLEAVDKRTQHRNEGLQLLRKNASKSNFFNELLKEVAKENRLMLPRDLFDVDFPFCRFIQVQSIEGDQLVKDRQQCFVNEFLHFSLTLWNAFRLSIQDFRLLCNNSAIQTPAIQFQLDETTESTVQCCLQPQLEGEFQVYGFEFETSGINFVHRFEERLVERRLNFLAVETLPLVQVRLHVDGREVDALELLTGELVELSISLQSSDNEWMPAEIRMYTNARLEFIQEHFNSGDGGGGGGGDDDGGDDGSQINQQKLILTDELMNPNFNSSTTPPTTSSNVSECQFALRMNGLNRFRMQSPSEASNNSIYLKVEYANERRQRCRTVTKTLELYVRECVQMERCGDSGQVLSVRNVLSLNELNIRVGDQSPVRLGPGLTGFFLIQEEDYSKISWTSQNRCGLIELPSNAS